MTEAQHDNPDVPKPDDDLADDQDAGPASRPTGAAAEETEAEQEDTDAGPASEPQE